MKFKLFIKGRWAQLRRQIQMENAYANLDRKIFEFELELLKLNLVKDKTEEQILQCYYSNALYHKQNLKLMKTAKEFLKEEKIRDSLYDHDSDSWIKDGLSNLLDEYAQFQLRWR